MIARPILRYPGGKFILAKWVIKHFPYHQTYVELYGGAASVLMLKPRAGGEFYNDLNAEVVEVFKLLRNKEMAAELERIIRLTPYSRDEYKAAYEPSDDPIERVRRIIFRSFAGHGSDSMTRRHAGLRGHRNKTSGVTGAQEWARYPDEIKNFVERLQGVCIENRPALTLIDMLDRDDTLFYADPPYVRSTRSKYSVKYQFEMSDADHEALAQRLHQIKGMAIVSGYKSDLYNRLYSDWKCDCRTHFTMHAKTTTECLWLSPNIQTMLF